MLLHLLQGFWCLTGKESFSCTHVDKFNHRDSFFENHAKRFLPHLFFFAFGPERFGPNLNCPTFQTFAWQCGPNLQRIRIAIWPSILAGHASIVACRCKSLQTPNMYLCKSTARINLFLVCMILPLLFWDILKHEHQFKQNQKHPKTRPPESKTQQKT